MTDRAVRLACAALVVAALVGGVATSPGASAQSTETIADTQINPDDVSLNVELRADGSAAWTVEYRVLLDDENTTEAFSSLRSDIEANESQYASEFGDRMSATAATAENATGREMSVENVSVTATRQQLPRDYGVVTYTFVWTNFAVVDDGEIRAGDALAGFFLDEETSLRFSWPEGHSLDTAQPQPADTRLESRTAVWNGPLEFGPNEPTLIVAESTDAGSETTTAGGDDGGNDGGGTDARFGGVPFAVALVVLAFAAGAGGWFAYRRHGGPGPADDPAEIGDAPDGAGAETANTSGAAGPGVESGASDAAAGAAGAASTATGSDGDGDAESGDAETDEASGADASPETHPWEDELLSNEERVLALVEHEGGRMKQQEVAQTLDWTDAKTSQVVRKMRDEDKLDAFRLGRENVLVLPGEELGSSDGGDGDA